LESEYDGNYYYNACRTPLRLGVDYLINGKSKAKTAVNKMNIWLLTSVSENVKKISNGYKLNGDEIYQWNDTTFIGPFTVGAMCDKNNQNWLNKLYKELVVQNNINNGDYYSNTIKLLSLIVISGNYWIPEQSSLSIKEIGKREEGIVVYPNYTKEIINFKFDSDLIHSKNISTVITDVSGKVLMKPTEIKYPYQLDISFLEKGLYFLSITIDNHRVVSKKIIKR